MVYAPLRTTYLLYGVMGVSTLDGDRLVSLSRMSFTDDCRASTSC